MLFADERTAQTSYCVGSWVPVIPLPPQPFCSLAAALPPSVCLPWFIVLFTAPPFQQVPAIWSANIRPSEMGMRLPSFVWISDDESLGKEHCSQSVCVWPWCGQSQLLNLWVHASRFAFFRSNPQALDGGNSSRFGSHLLQVHCWVTNEAPHEVQEIGQIYIQIHFDASLTFHPPTRLMIPLSVRDASIIGICFCFYSSITGRLVMQGGRRHKWPPHFPPFSLLSKPAPPPLSSFYSPFFLSPLSFCFPPARGLCQGWAKVEQALFFSSG